MPSALDEFEINRKVLNHLQVDESRNRLVGFLDWLESNPATRKIIDELMGRVSLNGLIGKPGANAPPRPSNIEETARLGLFVMQQCREGTEPVGFAIKYGIRPQYSPGNLQSYVDELLRRYIQPALDYIRFEIRAAMNEKEALENSQSEASQLSEKEISTSLDLLKRPCIFIGHGRSKLWFQLKVLLEEDFGLSTVNFESESRAGESVVSVLEDMLDKATFAILILTAEDETSVGSRRARQNVIHEAGLFQGRLGFKRAILLNQEGVEEFSNVAGLQHIPFQGDHIEHTFNEVRRVLKREKLINCIIFNRSHQTRYQN